MKLASFNNDRIGVVVDDDSLIDITGLLPHASSVWPPTNMLSLIADFPGFKSAIEGLVGSAKRTPRSQVRLNAPVPWPNKIIALPANYRAHIEEMKTGSGLISTFPADGQGFFLKANSSLSGPSDPIRLPNVKGREIHHECELAIIIGKGGRQILAADALDHIFGYSCLLDMVIRGKEERVMRKSFDTFCPLGPWIVTADEAPPHDQIEIRLTVGGELRQNASTRDLIVDIPQMIAMASSVMTLYPGDIIATGTPAGVGPVVAGDRVRIDIPGIGLMELDVIQDESGDHPVWRK